MTLDPQAKVFLDRAAAAGRSSYHTLPADEARREYRETRKYVLPPRPELASVVDRVVPGPRGPIPIRCYRPLDSAMDEILPVLVYFHGGGWTLGDLETHDIVCRELCNNTPCAVVAVDYRMGPEHKFPAAVDDCVAGDPLGVGASGGAGRGRHAHGRGRRQRRRQSCHRGRADSA